MGPIYTMRRHLLPEVGPVEKRNGVIFLKAELIGRTFGGVILRDRRALEYRKSQEVEEFQEESFKSTDKRTSIPWECALMVGDKGRRILTEKGKHSEDLRLITPEGSQVHETTARSLKESVRRFLKAIWE